MRSKQEENTHRILEAEGMRARGLPAFARPVSSTALCATVYIPQKDCPEPGDLEGKKVAVKNPR